MFGAEKKRGELSKSQYFIHPEKKIYGPDCVSGLGEDGALSGQRLENLKKIIIYIQR